MSAHPLEWTNLLRWMVCDWLAGLHGRAAARHHRAENRWIAARDRTR